MSKCSPIESCTRSIDPQIDQVAETEVPSIEIGDHGNNVDLNTFSWLDDLTSPELRGYLNELQISLDMNDLATQQKDDQSMPDERQVWRNPTFPTALSILSPFAKPYPFSLDPTRKFLRSIFNMSKTEMYMGETPESHYLKQLRTEYSLGVLFSGLMKKKRKNIRQDSTVLFQLVSKPNRQVVVKEDEPSYLPTNNELGMVCDAIIQAKFKDCPVALDQYLVRVMPSTSELADELENLVIGDPQNSGKLSSNITPSIREEHDEIIRSKLMEQPILSNAVTSQLQCQELYRKMRPEQGPIVSTLMIYAAHIGTNKEQTINWFLLISDETSWHMTPVMAGIISLQQLLLSMLCGGNIHLDYLSYARRPRILNAWCTKCTMENPSLNMETCCPKDRVHCPESMTDGPMNAFLTPAMPPIHTRPPSASFHQPFNPNLPNMFPMNPMDMQPRVPMDFSFEPQYPEMGNNFNGFGRTFFDEDETDIRADLTRHMSASSMNYPQSSPQQQQSSTGRSRNKAQKQSGSPPSRQKLQSILNSQQFGYHPVSMDNRYPAQVPSHGLNNMNYPQSFLSQQQVHEGPRSRGGSAYQQQYLLPSPAMNNEVLIRSTGSVQSQNEQKQGVGIYQQSLGLHPMDREDQRLALLSWDSLKERKGDFGMKGMTNDAFSPKNVQDIYSMGWRGPHR